MKSYPKHYFATPAECYSKKYRKASIKIAEREGIFGWRNWDKPQH